MKIYLCKGKRKANFMLDHGCRMIRIDCDQKNPGYLVFIFEWNECFDKALVLWEQNKDTYLIS